MGKAVDSITPELRLWLLEQKIFFVATAPLAPEGHLNCSPKGGDTFRVLNDREVAYLDLTGSGIETAAHIQQNGRIVLMFCAFSGPPRIVRLHGRGQVLYPQHPDFARLHCHFPDHPGVRTIIRISLDRVSESCGHGVPLMDFVARRDLIEKWCTTKGPEGLAAYRSAKNRTSIDGLPGFSES